MTHSLGAPATAPEPELVARLRADLHAAAYTVDAVACCLGEVASAALHREQPVPARRATEGSTDPVAILVRCFTLGIPCTAEQLDGALPSLGVAGATLLGIVAHDGEIVRATIDLRPYAADDLDFVVASDPSELALGAELPTGHVLGIGGASTTLASWALRRPVARALDLGTGCGIQSLHLAQHARHVVATDVSSRALRIARLNEALNGPVLGAAPWDLRAGDMLAPVAGERFDLIVSNPPFVITPRRDDVPRFEYRDGGRSGDAVVRDLLRDVGAHLEPGGVAQFLGNWEVPAGRDWTDVWSGWLDDLDASEVPLDAWVVQREAQDPAQYAELWARDGGARPGTDAFDTLYEAWLDDFAARGVEQIGFGVVSLQRPGGPGDEEPRQVWRSLDDVRSAVDTPMGPTIDAGLRARTWLARASDDEVLDVAWRVAADVTEERHGRPGDTDPAVILLRQGGGLGRVVRMDTVLAAYVSVADGELTARIALHAIAGLLDRDAGEVIGQALPRVRDLVANGLLLRNE